MEIDTAKQKIYNYFESLCLDYEIMILDEQTIENHDLYVFFYDSKEYLVGGDDSYALAGNSGIIVDKKNLDLYSTFSSHPIEYYIDMFRSNKSGLQKMD